MTPSHRAALAQQLVALGVSNLVDGGASVLPTRLRPTSGTGTVAGRAVTVLAPSGDNLAAQVGLANCSPGAMLVIASPHGSETAYWGELMTVSAQQRGLVGVVCDGPVRDVVATDDAGFNVWATSICAAGPTKQGGGSVNEAISIGDVQIRPGDWICADADGVCVINDDNLPDVLVAAERKAASEPALIDALRGGATTIELFGLDPSTVHLITETEPPRRR